MYAVVKIYQYYINVTQGLDRPDYHRKEITGTVR